MKDTHKKNNQTSQSLTFEQGRLLPQARELEEAVLSALMLEKDAYSMISDILTPECFYDKSHELIFTAIRNLETDKKPIDALTVVERLRKDGNLEAAGGVIHISQLTQKVVSCAHLEYHARIVAQKYIARRLITLGADIQSMAFDETSDISDVLEFAESSFTEISTKSVSSDAVGMNKAIIETLDYAARIQKERDYGYLPYVRTGLKELNRKLHGGWRAPDLIIIAGRPGMGKTQFALLHASAAGYDGKDCLFISIEMTKIQLIIRYLLEDERINADHILSGQLTIEEWNVIDTKAGQLVKMKLYIADDYNVRNLNTIKSLARKKHREGKLKLMIIDYLQLIRTGMKFGTRDQEIGYITGELKNLAKELNIPVITLAQLNRPERGTVIKLPQLQDLRESGNIEQDADIVIFIHRPSYYDSEANENGISWRNRGILIIAKHRMGEKDAKILFSHDRAYKKILDDSDIPEFG
ncbi:MAG: replicative DNA helicase [Candidatus Azobacteroides sp.]|nr:replicative DNA helicase [Candidatus Azobacteroides sp.]